MRGDLVGLCSVHTVQDSSFRVRDIRAPRESWKHSIMKKNKKGMKFTLWHNSYLFCDFWIVKWVLCTSKNKNNSFVPWLNESRILNKSTLLWEISVDEADLTSPVLLFYSLASYFLSPTLHIMDKSCFHILYSCALYSY